MRPSLPSDYARIVTAYDVRQEFRTTQPVDLRELHRLLEQTRERKATK